jgi:hypothetical protein
MPNKRLEADAPIYAAPLKRNVGRTLKPRQWKGPHFSLSH